MLLASNSESNYKNFLSCNISKLFINWCWFVADSHYSPKDFEMEYIYIYIEEGIELISPRKLHVIR